MAPETNSAGDERRPSSAHVPGRRFGALSIASVAAFTAFSLLAVAVLTGLHIPGLGFLSPFEDQGNLDYGRGSFVAFSPLESPFVSRTLGVDPGAEPSGGFSGERGGSSSIDGRTTQPEVVTHGLTNDDSSNPYPIDQVPFTARSNSKGATRQSSDPSNCSQIGGTVWYSYHPSETRGLLASTDGSGYPIALGVYEGTPRNLRDVGCDSNGQGSASVAFLAVAGASYLFEITAPIRGGRLVFSLRAQPTTGLASVSSAGSKSDGGSDQPSVSGDGRFVAFDSVGSKLDGPCGCGEQVYVRDLEKGTTEIVSVSSRGVPAQRTGGFAEGEASMSFNGRYVAFTSYADNLVPKDTNREKDVFLRDRLLKTTRRISVGPNGEQGNRGSYNAHLSADGRYVAFWSDAIGMDPRYPSEPHRGGAIYWKDLFTGEVRLVSVSSDGTPANEGSLAPTLSADGLYVAFASGATNLTPDGGGTRQQLVHIYNGENDRFRNHVFDVSQEDIWSTHVYVHEMATGRTSDECVSATGVPANDACSGGAISSGGRYIVFSSTATNLVPLKKDAAPSLGLSQTYLRDRLTGALELVSRSSTGAPGGDAGEVGQYPIVREYGVQDPRRTSNGNSYEAISADGRFVAFDTEAALVPSDTNSIEDVYVRDRLTGITTRVSVSTAGGQANGPSLFPAMSADGAVIAFISSASNLVSGDGNGQPDIFVRT